jgi:hypothetical protein
MRQQIFTTKTGWRVIALGCLLGLIATPRLFAKLPPPPPFGLGARILGTGGPVTLTIVPTDALFTSDIIVVECVPIDCVHIIEGTNRDSTEIPLGTVSADEEIDLRIFVQDTLAGFRSGPASRNSDNLAHALVTQESATTLKVGFEDIYGGGDRDFNDVIVEVAGAKMSVPFSGLPLSPLTGSQLIPDQNGSLLILPFLAGDASGASISLGDADGWQGTIDFDGQAPDSQLTYSAQSGPGLPDVVGRHTTSPDDGMTDLELSFPRALNRGPLQVNAFLDGQKVASTHVEPTQDQTLTFAPVRYLEAKTKLKKIKIKKITISTTIGPITIEGIEIVLGLTSGEIDGVGALDFDTLELTLSDSGFPTSGFSEVTLSTANVPSLTIESLGVSMSQQFHRALGGATLVPAGGALTVDHGAAGDDQPGVAIDLENAESFDLTWSPFIPLGLTLSGSSLELNSRGTVHGVADQDLGTLRITQLTMADTDAEITADFSAVGSPTQRILLYNGETLVADVTGHAGAAARALAWPTGVGKGQAIFGPQRLPCYTLPFPEDTWIKILGGPWMVGDKLLVLAENPDAGVASVSQLSVRATNLPAITLTGEAVTPLLPPNP